MKLSQRENGALLFKCPGCDETHEIYPYPLHNESNASWDWNESLDSPTFTPSVLVSHRYTDPARPDTMCHSFIANGQIQFLADCTHALAGQTVELAEVPL